MVEWSKCRRHDARSIERTTRMCGLHAWKRRSDRRKSPAVGRALGGGNIGRRKARAMDAGRPSGSVEIDGINDLLSRCLSGRVTELVRGQHDDGVPVPVHDPQGVVA